MHHAGVRSSVSERKQSVCFGLFYVPKILNNYCAYIFKKITFFLYDSYIETCARMRGCCWQPSQQLSLCVDGDGGQGQNATTGISHSADRGKNTHRLLNIHFGSTWLYIWIFFLCSFSPNSFPSWRTVTHCREKASRCILIRQRRGLQLIDITVILFWSTFFMFTALHCSLRVHRRLVAFFLHREG